MLLPPDQIYGIHGAHALFAFPWGVAFEPHLGAIKEFAAARQAFDRRLPLSLWEMPGGHGCSIRLLVATDAALDLAWTSVLPNEFIFSS